MIIWVDFELLSVIYGMKYFFLFFKFLKVGINFVVSSIYLLNLERVFKEINLYRIY